MAAPPRTRDGPAQCGVTRDGTIGQLTKLVVIFNLIETGDDNVRHPRCPVIGDFLNHMRYLDVHVPAGLLAGVLCEIIEEFGRGSPERSDRL